MPYYVYIMTNKSNRVLYIGMTNNLQRRLNEHKQNLNEGFTNRYRLHKLVYFETYPKPHLAIKREKKLKNWKREWKYELIRGKNPEFKELDPGSGSGMTATQESQDENSLRDPPYPVTTVRRAP